MTYEEIMKATGANSVSTVGLHQIRHEGTSLYWIAREACCEEGWYGYRLGGKDTPEGGKDAVFFQAACELNATNPETDIWFDVVNHVIQEIRQELGENAEVHLGILDEKGYICRDNGDHWSWANVAIFAKKESVNG